MCKIIFTLLVAYICGFHTSDANILDKCSKTLGIQKETTSVIFYAKRKGVALMIFKFLESESNEKVKLLKQSIRWRYESFLDSPNPPMIVNMVLAKMLREAVDEIPQTTWPTLPLTFFASTEFTKAPVNVTTSIYDQIQSTLEGLGFKMPLGSIVTLTEERKALTYWLSINILLGSLRSIAYSEPALVLGKRSNAFVYAPHITKMQSFREEDILCVLIDRCNFQLYRKTYNFGVEDIKMGVLRPKNKGSTVLTSPCIPKSANFTWSYDNKTYIIEGCASESSQAPETPKEEQCNPENIRYLNCVNDVTKAVLKHLKQPSHSFAGFNPYIVSSYNLSENTLFTKSADEDTSLINFKNQSWIACSEVFYQRPFVCLETVYMYVMLHKFYKMADIDIMKFRQYIDKKKITWALSAAYLTRHGVRYGVGVEL
ncbi:hypothetical protein RUM44_008250 [Polyplax serrata]|uniref:Uncharacterized protein n=1 Tax=Polyplax serrata TaxID=468196 RepID=A0ABR1BCN2_POLSC